MPPPKAIFDTNILIDSLNQDHRADLVRIRPLTRYLSAVVHMELRALSGPARAHRAVERLAAAYRSVGRFVAPQPPSFARAGERLVELRKAGFEVRPASLLNDLLIALTAREIGATLFTRDRDFEEIRKLEDFSLQIVD